MDPKIQEEHIWQVLRRPVSKDTLAENCLIREMANSKSELTAADTGLFPDCIANYQATWPKLPESSLDSASLLTNRPTYLTERRV